MDYNNIKLPLVAELNHASDRLNLYRAELARILGLHCQDVSTPHKLEQRLHTDTIVKHRAERFIVLYQLLETKFPGDDGVDLVHWFRKLQPQLGTTPLLAIVDERRLEQVITLLTGPHVS